MTLNQHNQEHNSLMQVQHNQELLRCDASSNRLRALAAWR